MYGAGAHNRQWKYTAGFPGRPHYTYTCAIIVFAQRQLDQYNVHVLP